MSTSKAATLKLLSEVTQTVEVFGEEATSDILFQARKINAASQHIDFVINMVLERFKFSRQNIIDSTKIKNVKKLIALKFICYYSYHIGEIRNSKHIGTGAIKEDGRGNKDIARAIAIKVKRHITVVRRYYREMAKKKKESKEDIFFQTHFKEFELQVKKYLKENK